MSQHQENRENAHGKQVEVTDSATANVADTININNYHSSRPARGIPFQALALPKDYVDRLEIRQLIKSKLIDCSVFRPGTLVVSAIYGLGGVGKSVMAAALAHDREVQEVCADGVLWVTLGQNPDLLPCLYSWVQALGDYDFNPTTIDSASSHLRSLLRDKKMLLVVDDAWNSDHVAPFQVGGEGCRVLVTTREAHVLDADRIDMDVMSEAEALELLLSKAQVKSLTAKEERQARKLIGVVGGLPLAVDLAGAQIADGMSWSELLEDLEVEIADLELLDRPNAEGVRDEKNRKRLSLKASLNLSLKLLSSEQLQQFAWLGVLPEDVAIQPDMAATLWSISRKKAGAVLRTFRAKALLLSGVQGLGQESSYRIHDLMHDLARGLLTSEGEEEIPGLGLQWSDAHGFLLDRYHLQSKGGQWHTLPDDGYIHVYLSWHMEQARKFDELHLLLREVTIEGRNGWFEACEYLGQSARFVADLGRAWKLAEEMCEVNTMVSIELQIRYALIFSTMNSLSNNIPAELIAAFVKSKSWSATQGLVYARQTNSSKHRSNIIRELAPCLPLSLFPDALDLVCGIHNESDKVDALITLSIYLPKNLLSEVLDIVCHIQNDSYKSFAISGLIPYLPKKLLSKALMAAYSIHEDSIRVDALIAMSKYLPESLLSEILDLASGFHNEFHLVDIIREFSDCSSEKLLAKMLNISTGMKSRDSRIYALNILMNYLPSDYFLESDGKSKYICSGNQTSHNSSCSQALEGASMLRDELSLVV
jgi:NB-ARC domain